MRAHGRTDARRMNTGRPVQSAAGGPRKFTAAPFLVAGARHGRMRRTGIWILEHWIMDALEAQKHVDVKRCERKGYDMKSV